MPLRRIDVHHHSSDFTAQIDGYAALGADGHAAVDRRNAEVLLPNLADREIA